MLDREEAVQGKVAELQRRKESEEIEQREQSSGSKDTPSVTLPSVSLAVRPLSVHPHDSVNSSGSAVTASNSKSRHKPKLQDYS